MIYLAYRGASKGTGVAPVYKGKGPYRGYPFTTAVPWPTVFADATEPAIGDIGICVMCHDGNTTEPTGTGWTEFPGNPYQDVATSDGMSLSLFYHRVTSLPPPTFPITDVGTVQAGLILLFSGVVATGDPWDVMASDAKTTASTTVTFPTVTTEVSNPLMLFVAGRPSDTASDQYSGYASTSGDVTGLTERQDSGAVSGTGQGTCCVTGAFVGPGATGTVTATNAASTTDITLTIALYG
jgi:hypothetical protein